MPAYAKYPVPHLLGKVNYQAQPRLRPDGDTVHLFDPLLLLDGHAVQPKDGCFEIWIPGNSKPRIIRLRGKPGNYYAPIRFEGIDAPEEHYRATPFQLKLKGRPIQFPFDPARDHGERSQPLWSPATQFAIGTLEKAGWGLVELDREVIDGHQRVLGYVYASNNRGTRKTYLSLELVRQGLAFPFLFESAGDRIPPFLQAATHARRRKWGVWKNYRKTPLSFAQSFPAPRNHTTPEAAQQKKTGLNFPVVFRRVVDSHQLQGLSLQQALQKYDAIDHESGALLPGDQYHKIPLESLIWAPHSYK